MTASSSATDASAAAAPAPAAVAVKAAPWYTPPTGKHGMFYFTNWSVYGRKYFVKDVPIDDVSDIAYSFFNLDAEGRVTYSDGWSDRDNPFIGQGVEPQNTWESPKSDLGCLGQFSKLQRAGKKFNLHLAIGGWTFSRFFSPAVSTPARRATIISSLRAIFTEWPGLFNGIVWDWEYITDNGQNVGAGGNAVHPKDPENFQLLLREVKAAFPDFKARMCVIAAPEKMLFDIKPMLPYLDAIDVMTYDFHSGNFGDQVACHHTNLMPSPADNYKYSAHQGVQAWLQRGVPPSKIYLGAAAYSRGFANAQGGLGKPASGNSPDTSWEAGVVDYKQLPWKGATEYYDDVSQASYSHDRARQVFNSYDTEKSVLAKCAYVWEHDLAGILVWEISGDYPSSNERSIVRTMAKYLTKGRPPKKLMSP